MDVCEMALIQMNAFPNREVTIQKWWELISFPNEIRPKRIPTCQIYPQDRNARKQLGAGVIASASPMQSSPFRAAAAVWKLGWKSGVFFFFRSCCCCYYYSSSNTGMNDEEFLLDFWPLRGRIDTKMDVKHCLLAGWLDPTGYRLIEISAVWYHWFAVWGPEVFVSYILFVNLQLEVVVFSKMRVRPPLKNVDQHTHTHTKFPSTLFFEHVSC